MRWLTLLVVCALSGCARHYTGDALTDPFGFWTGIWHGFVYNYALLTNITSWLAGLVGFELLQSIEIIGRPNSGFWYYCGFVLGLMPYGGGSSRS